MDDAELRAWLDHQTASNAFSGTVLAWQGGKPIFTYAGGVADRGHGVPIDEQTRFAVASITKMVTAIAALRLVDRGLVRLDQPLLEILPSAHRPAALTVEHTLHHLLSHTSGLADYHDDDDQTGTSFTACWDRIPTYHVRHPADMLPLFADLPPLGLPGERYRYNDANFILAGLVIEAVSGKPWEQVVDDEVFGPAGMTDSAIEALDDDPLRLATGYLMDDRPPERWRANIFSVTANGMPDGGMITSAVDLARLVDALLGLRLLPPALVGAMTRPQGPPSTDVAQYGYGCELGVRDGAVEVIGHGGSDPGVSARVSHHVAAATTVVALCNQDRGSWAASLRVLGALGLTDPRA